MKKLACTSLIALSAIQFTSAAEAPNEQQKTADAPAARTEEQLVVETKNKSSFVLEESGRNPFWPIGWKPAGAKSTNTEQQVGPEIQESAFLVSSITLDRDPTRRFAIINGKVMSEGQVFGLQMGSQTYQLTVKAIQDGQVVIARRDQEIVVPLRRR